MKVVKDISPITITAPVELIRYAVYQRKKVDKYETNRFIRAIGTWLILKSETTSGVIQNYSGQLSYLKSITQLSTASFYARLNFLKAEGLLTYNRNRIELCSNEFIKDKYFLHNLNKISFNYDPSKNQQIHFILASLEIKNNQDLQAAAFQRKIEKNPHLQAEQSAILMRAKADRNKMNNKEYVRQTLFQLQLQSFVKFRGGSEIFDALHKYRADVNRGVKGIAKAWEASPSTVCYWKKKMLQQEIIAVEKVGAVMSEVRARKDKKIFYTNWDKHYKQSLWYSPDQLQVLIAVERVVQAEKVNLYAA